MMKAITRWFGNRIRLFLVLATVIFGSGAACALFAPLTFRAMIRTVQEAGLSAYTLVLGVTGNPTLKVVVYEVDVTANAAVRRDLGVLSLIYGEGAEVTGTVRVTLGGNLAQKTFGVLGCELDARTIRSKTGRAPLAGAAFDSEAIKQEALLALEGEATKIAIKDYWPEARGRLRSQFASWALGVEVPESPSLTQCPRITPAQ